LDLNGKTYGAMQTQLTHNWQSNKQTISYQTIK
jgi:hypothetical protein